MNICFCAGGTLGHINPAITLINEIKNDNRIIFVTTKKDEKYDIIKNNKNIDNIYYLEAYGIPKSIFQFPNAIYKNIKVIKEIKKIFKNEKVDLVIGMGGYISGLGIYIANKEKIKTIIHEQNSVLGFANKLNIKKTDIILTSFENTIGINKNKNNVKVIGNPRYIEALKISKNSFNTRNNIIVTSGTLGSKYINDLICEMVNDSMFDNYTLTLITGRRYYNEVLNKIKKMPNIKIKPFSNNLLEDLSKAGIVISRAGSSTLFEILALKIPSIVIPSPNVTKNHQYYNAKNFNDLKLIKMIEESNLNKENLMDTIKTIEKEYDIYINNLEQYKIDCSIKSFIQEIKGETINEYKT